ncbi:MAG TPA: hydroxysqualene dehydroxylase HpnE [Acetobacteraceae bacterium]|nr:hydroxysqualene dehydroxylase HpnE [Acetobacteraceae bacterium]
MAAPTALPLAGRVHVIGGGVAGLSAALALTAAGRFVTLHEAGPMAGGRCRSYFDREIGLSIDNGNHLLLSGNRAAFAYLDEIGAADTLGGPDRPLFPFMALDTGQRWTLRPSRGRLPWWILSSRHRVPGTRAIDYLALLRLRGDCGERTVADSMPRNQLYHRLIEPLAIAALNTPPSQGLARLLGAVVRETLMRGGAACLPRFPRETLARSLVDPAVAMLRARGAELVFTHRVTMLDIEAGRVAALRTPEDSVALGPNDGVVLAVPPWIATTLLPQLTAPAEFEAILNVHFRIQADPGPAGFIGLVGGTAEWVFVKADHVSVTISAANRMVDRSAEAIAAAVWPDVRAALRLPNPMPLYRVVKEKRATFAATAEQERRRPGARTPIANLMLAGDWTDTGLPATIEGAIRSGRRAAELFRTT